MRRIFLATAILLISFQATAIDLVPGDIVMSGSVIDVFLQVDPITGDQAYFPSFEDPQQSRGAEELERDADGNLFFIDRLSTLYRLDRATGATSGFSNVNGAALGLDQSGNALVMRGKALTRIDPDTGVETVISSLENVVGAVGDIAEGIDGEIYLAAETFSTPQRPFLFGINPINGGRRTITDLPHEQVSLFVESSGDILVANLNYFQGFWRIDPVNGTVKDVLANGLHVIDVSTDSSGAIFALSQFASGAQFGIIRVDPISGQWDVVSRGFLLYSSQIAVIPGLLPECRDGIDNDGDGFVDFLEEPGCEDSLDPTEFADSPLDICSADLLLCEDDLLGTESDLGICEDANAQLTTDLLTSQVRVAELEIALDQCLNPPIPPTQCNDGIDNDGDGSIDLDDRQCLNAEQNSEKNRNR